MGLITISGEPGCRFEEVAQIVAQRLGCEVIRASRLASFIEQEFGAGRQLPETAYPDAVKAIVAGLAREHHLILAVTDAELLLQGFPGVLRVKVSAPAAVRVGQVMLEERQDRSAARRTLRERERAERRKRTLRFKRATPRPELFDLVCNAEQMDSDVIAGLVESACRSLALMEQGFLSAAAEAQIQFRIRLRLAKHGIAPPGSASLEKRRFAHPSEEIFANLLDFYRIAWEYEPRSFPVQWDRQGRVSEAFTPDFYLPEFDLYVELTTMKQSLVTRKNRKVKLLRELYPHVNIQVFYQKDIENLIFKYGLSGRQASTPS
ncbi:MAG: cytidylate kinase family protein [Bryobacterales bacterium]|nr:cytidylate kinase family protein [Bryobacterales bacterium]